MIIELLTFHLAPEADEAAFLAADDDVQQRFAHHQPGLVRRTTARGADGAWLVVDQWWSSDAADACDTRWADDAAAQAFMAFVDPATIRTERYETLD